MPKVFLSKHKHLKSLLYKNKLLPVYVMIVFGLVGVTIILIIRAAGSTAFVEPENGNKSSSITVGSRQFYKFSLLY
jgi:hypothetical protein